MNNCVIPLFEDNHLLVLNKPAGLLTQPTDNEPHSLEQQAKSWLKIKYQKPGNVFLTAIHRLDKSVSGIVVFSKTSKVVPRLNTIIQSKQTRKIYHAWVEGIINTDSGTLENFIVHDHFHAKIVEVSYPQAKLACLHYCTIMRSHNRSLVEIQLDTGRYHQIRVQMAAIGHPIWGDLKYGCHHFYHTDAIALHHKTLQLQHPISHIEFTVQAPLPCEFNKLLT